MNLDVCIVYAYRFIPFHLIPGKQFNSICLNSSIVRSSLPSIRMCVASSVYHCVFVYDCVSYLLFRFRYGIQSENKMFDID